VRATSSAVKRRRRRDPVGYWCPVLHAHLPFVRHPEQPTFLEEDWFFEAMTESYLPLLMVFDELAAEGTDFRLTMTLSPTLLSMMSDALLIERYQRYLDRLVELAEREVVRTRREAAALRPLAESHLREFKQVRRTFRTKYHGDVIAAFARHRAAGRVEILTSAATHAFLPLLDPVPQSVRAQVLVGADVTRRFFGTAKGIWLPECAYHPGVEAFLKEAGLGFSFLEAHGLTHAHPRPTHGVAAPILSPGGVVFFGRDHDSSRQVWSADAGYPGDPAYREFYRDIGWDLPTEYLKDALRDGLRRNLGIKYHRVTGKVALATKEIYDPAVAAERVATHALDFVQHRQAQAQAMASGMDRPPIIVSPYDAELFGHWWYEGPRFIASVFRRLHEQDEIRCVTPLEYLQRHPNCEVAQPPLSSWGAKGYGDVWLNPSNDWIYPHLDMAAERMTALAARYEKPVALQRRALNQAARELMLAQASDWPFIMTTGTAVEYAKRRLRDHVARFTYLFEALSGERTLEAEVVRDFERRDNLFPDLDYRIYR
jgi:1,4-alpha-glucan branching enzyme